MVKYIGKLSTIFIVTFIIFHTSASSILNDESIKRTQPPSEITIDPNSVIISNNKPLKLQCVATNFLELSKIFWIVGKSIESKIEELKKSHTQYRLTDSANYMTQVNSTYIIDCPSEHDSNSYTCVVFAGDKTYKASSHVTVIDRSREKCGKNVPKIFENVHTLFIEIGSNATLHCNMPNNPEMTWMSDHSMNNERYKIEGRKFRIRHVTWDDAGFFECKPNNNSDTGYGHLRTYTYFM